MNYIKAAYILSIAFVASANVYAMEKPEDDVTNIVSSTDIEQAVESILKETAFSYNQTIQKIKAILATPHAQFLIDDAYVIERIASYFWPTSGISRDRYVSAYDVALDLNTNGSLRYLLNKITTDPYAADTIYVHFLHLKSDFTQTNSPNILEQLKTIVSLFKDANNNHLVMKELEWMARIITVDQTNFAQFALSLDQDVDISPHDVQNFLAESVTRNLLFLKDIGINITNEINNSLKNGKTLLRLAVEQENRSLVQILLSYGAMDESAYEYAAQNNLGHLFLKKII